MEAVLPACASSDGEGVDVPVIAADDVQLPVALAVLRPTYPPTKIHPDIAYMNQLSLAFVYMQIAGCTA